MLKKFINLKLLEVLILIFICILFTPRIALIAIPGISSILRVDSLLTFALAILGTFYLIYAKQPYILYVIVFYIIWRLSVTSMGAGVFIASSFLYISLFICYRIGNKVSTMFKSKDIWNFILVFVAFNCLLHLFSVATGLSYNAAFESNSGEEELIVIGKYGVLAAPYNFVIIVALTWFVNYFITKKFFSKISLLFLISLIFSDSRSGFGIVILLFGFEIFVFGKLSTRIIAFFTFIPMFVFLIVSPIEIKALSGFKTLDLLGDASFLMRVDNFYNWLDWLTPTKFLFGGGAQIFLEFSTQYGSPGPFDVLPLRIVSEIGIVGLVLISGFLVFHNFGKLKKNGYMRIFFYCLLWMFLLGFFNESMMSIKGGQFYWFLLGLLKSDFKIGEEDLTQLGKFKFPEWKIRKEKAVG